MFKMPGKFYPTKDEVNPSNQPEVTPADTECNDDGEAVSEASPNNETE